MAKNDFGNFIAGLLGSFTQTAISERDKNREQARLDKEESRQNAVLSLQRLQNKQRVDEFNKSFEFTKDQTNVENVRNDDKTKFDKMLAYKEYVKQYAPKESMPDSPDGFKFNQTISGSIDDDFANATGTDLLKNDVEYYDVNAYQEGHNNYLQKMAIDATRENTRSTQNMIKAKDLQILEAINREKLIRQFYDKLSGFGGKDAGTMQNQVDDNRTSIYPLGAGGFAMNSNIPNLAANRQVTQGTYHKLNYLKNFLQGTLKEYSGQLSGREMMNDPLFQTVLSNATNPLDYLLQNSLNSGLAKSEIGSLRHLKSMLQDFQVAPPVTEEKE